MSRTFEKYIILLREDLKISSTCSTVKEGLLKSIKDKTYFSDDLAEYFQEDIPFKIESTDPTQVVALKKILNALHNVEKSFRAIESLNISRDRYKIGVAKDTAAVSSRAIHEIYGALKLINESSVDIQNIAGPHFQKLLPQVSLASKALGSFTPEHPEESVGAVLGGAALGMLPTEALTEEASLGNVSQLIYQLPHYFEELQKLISIGGSDIATKSITSAKSYQAAMLAKASFMQRDFQKLSDKGGLFSYFRVLSKLVSHSTDLVNTAAPFTKQAYVHAVEKLEDIKHNILPQLISELELVEESMGLKPGVLTQPALEQMNEYYTQLANQVNNIARAAGVIDSVAARLDSKLGRVARLLVHDRHPLRDPGKPLTPAPDLNVLMDDQFIARRRAYQESRLNEARFSAAETSVAEAANRFFTKIGSYNTWVNRSLAALSQSDKDELVADYKKIQPHFAILHPAIDRIIVDALTKTTQGIATRLYGDGLKELWCSNHFTTIIKCKTGVLEHISQNVAQARFREKLVAETMKQAEQTPSKLHMKSEAQRVKAAVEAHKQDPKLPDPGKPQSFQTNVTEIVIAFQPLPFKLEDNKSADHYHNQGIAVSNQITELERAQSGAKDFFDCLSSEFTHDNPTIASLNETQKEKLRSAYKKFQVSLAGIGPGYKAVNELVMNLSSGQGTLDIKKLVSYKAAINDNLNRVIVLLQQDRTAYFDQERVVRQREYSIAPLEPKGVEFGRKTLFGHLHDLKLSKSLDDFFNDKFQKYLKENLSPIVWQELSTDGEKINVSKLPFKDLHKDIPEVVMYKNLINAIHHTKTGLQELEQLNDYGDPNYLATRKRFVKKAFDALVMNIVKSKKYLGKAASNPALKEMMQEAFDLLDPLKDMPIIGDYLKSEETQEVPKQDIIEAWQQQQELVRAALSPTSRPKPKTDQQLISEKLNEILNKLDGQLETTIEPNKQLKAYVKEQVKVQLNALSHDVSGLSFGPGAAKKIVATLDNFKNQLSSIIEKSSQRDKSAIPELVRQLDQTHANLRAQLKEAAEYKEFYSGKKIGTYSSVIHNKTNNFYKNLINNLSLVTGLKSALSSSNTQNILAKKEDSALQQKKQSNFDRIKAIFGTDHVQFNRLYQPYMLMRRIVDDCNVAGGLSFTELKDEVVKYYKVLQPELVKINPAFDQTYITKCSDLAALLGEIDTLFAARHRINAPSSPFDKLKDLYLEGNFTRAEAREQFRQCYREIQPYLRQIDASYNTTDFLSTLTAAEHFKAALQKIMNEEHALTIPLNDSSYLQLIAENLYQIPIRLNKLRDVSEPNPKETNKKIKEFVDGLSGLSFGPASVQKILRASTKLQIQLSKIGAVGRELTMSHLKEIQSEFGAILMEAADSAEFNLGLKPGTYAGVVNDRFDKFYAALIANIPLEKDQAGLELLIDVTAIQKRLAREQERLRKITADTTASDTEKNIFGVEEVDTMQQHDQLCSFDKLMDLSFDADFAQEEDKISFLHCYAELQPFLVKINSEYDQFFYLRELQTPADFKKAVEQISEDKAKLQELIAGMNHTKEIKKQLCEERIAYFNKLLEKQEKVIAPQKIEAFKEKVFSNCLHAHIESFLTTEFGQDNAEFYLQVMMPEFLANKADILKDITLKDDIEEKITAAIMKILPATKENKKEAFKELVFNNYLNKNIKNLLPDELGIYTDLFVKKLSPEFEAQKSAILKDLALDKNINTTIKSRMDAIAPAILQHHSELKRAYSELNKTFNQVNMLLVEEDKKPGGNSCSAEKFARLESLKQNLIEPQGDTVESLTRLNQESLKALKSLEHHDVLITTYDVLNSLKRALGEGADLSEDKKVKLEAIIKMQLMLVDSTVEASQRLRQVREALSANVVLSEAFKGQFYVNYINTTIKATLQKELGPYSEVFLQRIMPYLLSKKEAVIADLSIENINSLIDAKVAEATQDIYKKSDCEHFKKVGKQLNILLNEINQLIQEEETTLNEARAKLKKEIPHASEKDIESRLNPCSVEKLAELNSYREKLMSTGDIPELEAGKFLQTRLKKTEVFFEKLDQYDKMIAIHGHLDSMQATCDKELTYSLKGKREKTKEISKMKEMLTDTSDSPDKRLAKLKKHGLSNACKKILFKNADDSFINECKKFFALLLAPIIPYFKNKFISMVNEKNTLSRFKLQLFDIKEKSVPEDDLTESKDQQRGLS